jgi:hypothetical protein
MKKAMNGLLKDNSNSSALKILGVSLVTIIALYVGGNFLRQHESPILGEWYALDFLFIILPVIAIVIGLKLIVINKDKKEIKKAWILFTIAISLWFVGELTYSYDVEYSFEDISSLTSDIFFIAGYPAF